MLRGLKYRSTPLFLFLNVFLFIHPCFYLAFSAMLLSFALDHFSSFDGITRPLNFSIKKLVYHPRATDKRGTCICLKDIANALSGPPVNY